MIVMTWQHGPSIPGWPPAWTSDMQAIAWGEGWILSRRADGYMQIQRRDDYARDWYDFDVLVHCRRCAEKGSRPHQIAIMWHGAQAREGM